MVKETKFYDILGVSITTNILSFASYDEGLHFSTGRPRRNRLGIEDSLQKGSPKTSSRYTRLLAILEV